MKFGVLGFSYTSFTNFERQLGWAGCYTVNLGDNAQTIASRHVFRAIGVPDDEVVRIDRDTLPVYSGDPAALLMNGYFTEASFPIPDCITPLFVGFSAREDVVAPNRDYFLRWGPIGCRDTETTRLMQASGIPAFTSGCITLALPRRAAPPAAGKLLVIYGSWSGALPASVLGFAPKTLLDTAEFIFHRLPVNTYPLTEREMRLAEAVETDLFRQYRDDASLVLTPLHHVAAPCMAMGVPVIIARKDLDARFDFLRQLVPVHTPGSFHGIDWAAPLPAIDPVRDGLVEMVKQLVSRLT